MKKYLKFVIIIIYLVAFTAPVMAGTIIDEMRGVINQSGIDLAAGDTKNPEVMIGAVFRNVLVFLGVVFFLLVVYGGILWMTAAGNEEKVTKAKKILISASIGIGVVLGAYFITYLIIYIFQSAMVTPVA